MKKEGLNISYTEMGIARRYPILKRRGAKRYLTQKWEGLEDILYEKEG